MRSTYEPTPARGEYEPLPEDRNKTIILYGPICQYSFQFAKRTEAIIEELTPNLSIELIHEWEKPEESTKRRSSSIDQLLTHSKREVYTHILHGNGEIQTRNKTSNEPRKLPNCLFREFDSKFKEKT